MNKPLLSLIVAVAMSATSCDKPNPSFHLGEETESFLLSLQYEEIPQKIDILWVIDNSGSMRTSQERLGQNFSRFIQNFIRKQYDFRMAFITTDAYRGFFNPNELYKRNFRRPSSGELFLTHNTENLFAKFAEVTNVGINGHGDERAFHSIEYALMAQENAEFRRPDAYFAIIILSDEDDFSATGVQFSENYNRPDIIPVSHYFNFLNQFAGPNNFSVHSISILDEMCRNRLTDDFRERKIAQRYHQLVALSGGSNASLCDSFADAVELIADKILRKIPPTTVYYLTRDPRIETLRVYINNEIIEQNSENGWSFNPADRSLKLHGAAANLIQDGGRIDVTFIPINPFDR